MGYVLSLIVGKLSSAFLKKVIYITLMTVFYVSMVAMWSSFAIAFFYFLEKIQFLLSMLSYSGSDTTVLKFFGLLHCIGIIDAFNETKSVWLSGITFIVARIMYIQTTKAYAVMLSALGTLLK